MICEIETRIQWRKNFSNRTNRKKVIAFFRFEKSVRSGFKICPGRRFCDVASRRRKKNWKLVISPGHF